MIEKLPKIIAIVGPTASGKTALSLELAQKTKGYIISADSRQLYKGLNIGTDKVMGDSLIDDNGYSFILHQGILHYMVDILSPKKSFSVAEYKQMAEVIIEKKILSSQLPYLVGGTMLYTQAVIDNYEIPHIKPDFKLRKKLENRIDEYGLDSLAKELFACDPDAVQFIDKNNPRRVIRALEVCQLSKKTYSSQRKKSLPKFLTLQIGKQFERDKLKEKINIRVDKYINEGLIDEVNDLLKHYKQDIPAFNTIAYKQIIAYIKGQYGLEEAIKRIKHATWQYAKRQITWYKKDSRINWVADSKEAMNLVLSFLEK